jgi:hypothetical protein
MQKYLKIYKQFFFYNLYNIIVIITLNVFGDLKKMKFV